MRSTIILFRRFDPFHIWLLIANRRRWWRLPLSPRLPASTWRSASSFSMLAPAVTVVGYEMLGHRHQAEALANDL